MSSDPEDDFVALLKANGIDVEVTENKAEEIEYTGASLDFPNEDGYPITIRVEFPVGHAMDAARALVLAGSAEYVPYFLAGALTADDASVHGYVDANGIDAAAFIKTQFAKADAGPPDLSEADEFFNLDK